MAKIRKECLGLQMKSLVVNKWFTITEGNEKTYKALGFDVFESAKKSKKDADNSQSTGESDNGNGNGAGS